MIQSKYDIVIVGAGPAGLIAAIESYRPARKILVLEKMHQPAIKLQLSGKGRCNITNDADLREFISHFGKNGRFLKYAFSEFFNKDLLEYFNQMGIKFKLERGGRYFPKTDNAVEISDALLKRVKALNIPLITKAELKHVKKLDDNRFALSILYNGQENDITSEKVILATGGKSYPKTGSTGAGFKIADELGHTITPPRPALVPIETVGALTKKLQGLSLKNVNVSVWSDNKKVCSEFGEMLFTHFGVSGPIVLSLSNTVVKLMDEKKRVEISIDLKPALDHDKVEMRLLREINEHSRLSFKNLLKKLMPSKLVPVFAEILGVSGTKRLNQISANERKKLRMLLKELRLEVSGYRSFDKAIVTSGGVSIKEIDSHTMESRIVKGLYFAGEVIDVDADTGGFNLQAAFSTGWIAGRSQ